MPHSHKSKKLRWAGHVARMKKVQCTLNILTRKPTGKRPQGTPMLKWEDNFRIKFKEKVFNTRIWIN